MRRSGPAAAVLLGGFALLVVPLILSGRGGTSEAWDQEHYHLPTILAMSERWLAVEPDRYLTATAPGYHLALAAVARFVSGHAVVLQLAGSLFSLGLLLALHRQAGSALGPWVSLAVLLPFVASSYVIGGAVWLVTDNSALLFVVLAVGMVLLPGRRGDTHFEGPEVTPTSGSPEVTPTSGCPRGDTHLAGPGPGPAPAPGPAATTWRLVAAGSAAAATVLVRQIHLWAAGPALALALLSGPLRARLPETWRAGLGASRPLLTVPAALLPLAVVGGLAWHWGGLTPPGFAERHQSGLNPAVIPVGLALLGAHGLFFLPALARRPRDLLGRSWTWVAVGAGVAAALMVRTSYDRAAGRWGGAIWEVVRLAPSIGGRSLILSVLAGLGGLVLAAGLAAAARGPRPISALLVPIAIAGWLAAHAVGSIAFQRYLEPVALVVLVWLVLLAPPSFRARRWWLGPLALGAIQLALSSYTVYWQVIGA